MPSSQAIPSMTAIYNLAVTVAANNLPPASITSPDTTVGVYYSVAPAQQFNPQFFIAITGIEADKQVPTYIGLGRAEEFEISGVVWGGVVDPSTANLQTLTAYLVGLLNALDTAINADPSLGGLLIQSWLADYTLEFDVENQGKAAFLTFAVHCEALTS